MTLQIKTIEEYQSAYARSVEDPEGFWAEQAETFHWRKPWDEVLHWDFKGPDVKWFVGGKLNITENCLDRHLETRGDQTAIIWEPNDPSHLLATSPTKNSTPKYVKRRMPSKPMELAKGIACAFTCLWCPN